ncbi:reverse transcriptase domain-containing protein [Tanacetum coccineum]|uniref:Reverse transcriptase domain-containing protein n=1 Tax=Tanacetum coccineum TaxID=301880 RepID=A0ABQ5A378_9ASTR
MVKKSDGGWRMCVDFTDINKACPKDCYPLPEIDWKVESLSRFWLKCFLDAYKGYHQIQMAKGDEDKTAFFAGEGVFCYQKIPFGLKNARATYHRLVDKVFHYQIGRNLEAYVDDMVIKSTSEEEMLADIKETFEKFQSINMKLNPKKCSFGIEEGPFLGHMITKQGIRANPSKQGGYEGEHDIVFQERGNETPKDFLIEVPLEDNKKETKEKADTKPAKTSCEWKLFTHGVMSSDSSDARLMLIDPEGKEYTYALRFGFETTNNEAEYEALLVGLRISQEMEITSLAIFVESSYCYTIEHIRRNQNKKADALSKLASMTFEHLTKEVLVEVLSKRSIEEKEILQVETKEGESWMTPIHEYLVSGLLPEDPKESRKIRVKAPQYKLIKGNLYRRSFYTSWLRCVASPQTDDIMKEVHKGSCGYNTEPRSMVVRITKQGITGRQCRDAAKILQDSEKCKEQSAIKKVAESNAMTAESGWPFSHWGVNILGPLPTAPRGFKFLAIACADSECHEQSARRTRSIFEKKLARSQQGWVDDLAQLLWIHRTLLRNSQKETPFSLTYSSEAIIPISKTNLTKDDRGRIKEVDKRRGSKEIASIEDAYYQSKLHKHHSKRSSHSNYNVGYFVLLSQNNIGSTQV